MLHLIGLRRPLGDEKCAFVLLEMLGHRVGGLAVIS